MKQIKSYTLGILFLCLFWIISASPALCQEYRSFRWERTNVENLTRFQVGPFRLYPTIRIREIGYDDNVYRQEESDEIISDFTATFSPEAEVFVLYKDWLILYLKENPEYVYFAKE